MPPDSTSIPHNLVSPTLEQLHLHLPLPLRPPLHLHLRLPLCLRLCLCILLRLRPHPSPHPLLRPLIRSPLPSLPPRATTLIPADSSPAELLSTPPPWSPSPRVDLQSPIALASHKLLLVSLNRPSGLVQAGTQPLASPLPRLATPQLATPLLFLPPMLPNHLPLSFQCLRALVTGFVLVVLCL
ncbi:hypothetical protein B9Z19DRAFT_813730 [Tuber borchii]|uniref:Uncharacterized protein n=1 Tax=Tuber borchii TaxID=42251 RepID=A0A2T6ZVS1_TUBBO|nr:hypothetical protein B9Z19DRAFT_813730 [Tuber borchii]